ncbi:hypothetical protein B4U80_13872 [Leptotrombidium deliense]|uniref:F-box domain-containing protein n=1 Tax=Leptotrombidium deliense TaxID=299467 RepID=A0A443SA05_9ACAR|nr:hypothetical protein B4U80_13872 [Leptotrombidium deliense]
MDEEELPQLPAEVWHRVLNELPAKERLEVATVSKMWNELIVFPENRIIIFEVGFQEEDEHIFYPNYKICYINSYSQFIGVIKRHTQMTHLKIKWVVFENMVISNLEIHQLWNEIAMRQNAPVPIRSFEIVKRNATLPMHFIWINHFRTLDEFVWRDAELDLMAETVDFVVRHNELQHLAVRSYNENLHFSIDEPLQTFTFETHANIDRQQIWNSLVANCTQSLTLLGALLYIANEMEYVNAFQNLRDLRLHLLSDQIAYRFAFNAEQLRSLTLYYQENAPPFVAVRHLFRYRHNDNLEILDLNLPLTTAYQLGDICASSRNLRLLKVFIEYRMAEACVTAITHLRNLEQLHFEFPIVEHNEKVVGAGQAEHAKIVAFQHRIMDERLLVAILNSPLLPNLRVIIAPEPTLGEESFNALVARAQLTPDELFFFFFSNEFNYPQHEQVKEIGDVPWYFFQFTDLFEYEYFIWKRITPEYFIFPE